MLPRLVLLAACEKVITDTSGLISLITLLEKLEVTVPPGADLPPKSMVPVRWETFSWWHFDNPEECKNYEYRLEVRVADGSLAMHNEGKFKGIETGKTGFKLTAGMQAVPISGGALELRAFCRKIGDPDW